MERNISVKPVKDLVEFEALKPEWDELLAQTPCRNVFMTWEWQFAWWKHLGSLHNSLYILEIRDGKTLIGLLPLMKNIKRKLIFTLHRLETLGIPDCDVSGLITINSSVCAAAVLQYLREHSAEWDMLELQDIEAALEPTDQCISQIHQAGYGTYINSEPHYYIPIHGIWDSYFDGLSHSHKHNLRRRLHRASEEGELKLKRYRGEGLKWENFETIFHLNEKGNFPELYDSEEERNFHLELFERTKHKNWQQIEILYLNDEAIAFQYGFVYEGRYLDWRGGFDKAHAQIAPGKMLAYLSMQDRFSNGCNEIDFLRGCYEYKNDWRPLSRKFVNIKVYNTWKVKPKFAYLWSVIRRLVRRQ